MKKTGLIIVLLVSWITQDSFTQTIFTSKNTQCDTLQLEIGKKIFAKLPGHSAGSKLESLLFWTTKEREQRFPQMQSIFPSIRVAIGNTVKPLNQGSLISNKTIQQKIKTYMKSNNIKGLIVLKNDSIRIEKYAKGVSKTTLWTSFSMAKSVTSMLLSVALKEGSIKSLDDSLQKYIPALNGFDYGAVTVKQLLTMTSGIEWNEDYEDPLSDVAQMYRHPCKANESHILTYMKKLHFSSPIEKNWHYSTGETDLLGILLQKATGVSLAEYLSTKIWQPFGMENCAYWLSDECSGENIGGSGISATLRDYARLGKVMMHQGKISDSTIFSPIWLNNSTDLLFPIGEKGGYGYLWWIFPNGSYAAVGIFGQMIYINPTAHLIIAQVAAWPKATSEELTINRMTFIKLIEHLDF